MSHTYLILSMVPLEFYYFSLDLIPKERERFTEAANLPDTENQEWSLAEQRPILQIVDKLAEFWSIHFFKVTSWVCRFLQSLNQPCSQSNSVSEGGNRSNVFKVVFFIFPTCAVYTLDNFQHRNHDHKNICRYQLCCIHLTCAWFPFPMKVFRKHLPLLLEKLMLESLLIFMFSQFILIEGTETNNLICGHSK